MIPKVCPQCGGSFEVYPSGAGRICCSRTCANTYTKLGKPKDAGRGRGTNRARQMSSVEAAWLAGLFDGEGTVALAQRDRPGGGTVRVSLVNTCRPLIDRLVEVVGCGTVSTRVSADPRHNDLYIWTCYGATAKDLLAQMRPWLIVKAERADDAVAGRVFPRQDRWTEENLPRRRRAALTP